MNNIIIMIIELKSFFFDQLCVIILNYTRNTIAMHETIQHQVNDSGAGGKSFVSFWK